MGLKKRHLAGQAIENVVRYDLNFNAKTGKRTGWRRQTCGQWKRQIEQSACICVWKAICLPQSASITLVMSSELVVRLQHFWRKVFKGWSSNTMFHSFVWCFFYDYMFCQVQSKSRIYLIKTGAKWSDNKSKAFIHWHWSGMHHFCLLPLHGMIKEICFVWH